MHIQFKGGIYLLMSRVITNERLCVRKKSNTFLIYVIICQNNQKECWLCQHVHQHHSHQYIGYPGVTLIGCIRCKYLGLNSLFTATNLI